MRANIPVSLLYSRNRKGHFLLKYLEKRFRH